MRVRLLALVALVGGAVAAAGCSPPLLPSDAGQNDAGTSSRTVGPEGGTLSLGSVTLTIPPGALATPQTVSITRAADAPPAPYAGYSPVYRFAPAGLTFAMPARVTFWVAGDATRASVYWSRANDPSAFERLETTPRGDRVSAPVTHFSDGFAGSEPAPPRDGGMDVVVVTDVPPPPLDTPVVPDTPAPPDAPAPDVLVPDAPTTDASRDAIADDDVADAAGADALDASDAPPVADAADADLDAAGE